MANRTTLMTIVLLSSVSLTVSSEPLAAQEANPRPWVATTLSGGTTLIGLGLIPVAAQFDVPTGAVLGVTAGVLVLFGPSTGFVYAGRPWRGAKSVLLRVGALGVALGGVGVAGIGFGNTSGEDGIAAVLVLSGVAVAAISTIYDVLTVGATARRVRDEGVEVGLLPNGFGVRIPLGP